MTSKLEELRNRFKYNPEMIVKDDKKKKEGDEDLRRGYKLEDGLNKYRPVVFDDGALIKELEVHMNLGVPFVCPKTYGERCHSCDFGWKLYKENGNQHTDESRNYLKQSKWVMRGIVRSKEESDIEKYGHPVLRFIDFSPTNGKTIQNMNSPENIEEFGDLTDLISGRDLLLTKDKEKAKLKQASVTIERGGKDTPVFSKVKPKDEVAFEDMLNKMFDNATKLEERFTRKTEEEVMELMENHLKKLQKSLVDEEGSSFRSNSEEYELAASSLNEDDEMSDFDEVLNKFKK